ncbi:baeRF7 domain-containing protein [Salinispira pacifica]
MHKPTMQQLSQLAERRDDSCFSFYMPTQTATREVKQNPIRFKNLVGRARDMLEKRDLSRREIDEFLAPGERLINDDPFWQHQAQGLSALLSSDGITTFKLPFEVAESVELADRFIIKPLLPLHSRNGVFYFLELGLRHVRLYQAGRYSYSEVDLPGIPAGIEETLRFDEPQAQLHSHTRRPERSGAMNAVFHGHGVGIDERKEEIRRYFLDVERVVSSTLADSTNPLVLVGIEYLLPIYREVNSYPHLSAEGVPHNPQKDVRTEDLHRQAWEIVRPQIEQTMRQAKERFGELAKAERASTEIEEIVEASWQDRVETLFLNPHEAWYGEADGRSGDLIDVAAVQTIRHGGTVYTMDDTEDVPGPSAVAAIFRY